MVDFEFNDDEKDVEECRNCWHVKKRDKYHYHIYDQFGQWWSREGYMEEIRKYKSEIVYNIHYEFYNEKGKRIISNLNELQEYKREKLKKQLLASGQVTQKELDKPYNYGFEAAFLNFAHTGPFIWWAFWGVFSLIFFNERAFMSTGCAIMIIIGFLLQKKARKYKYLKDMGLKK